MFRKNSSTYQSNLFSFASHLGKKITSDLYKTPEYYFFQLIFLNIDETIFAPIYSTNSASRPNAPINSMISALILKEKKDWTYEELFNCIKFDLRVRLAIGLNSLDEQPFCRSSLFNFQNKLASHFKRTSENLLEQVFNSLSQEQLKKLRIKTNIQRSDSFLVNSNIRHYSRLQLLVECIIRLHRILSEDDKAIFKNEFTEYIRANSVHFIYKLKSSEITHKMSEIGTFYHLLYETFRSNYKDKKVFQLFERVYKEHFKIVENKIEIIPSTDMNSNILQSPDDVDATYRKKRQQKSQGYSINIVETASLEAPLHIITDVSVASNNVDDSKILNNRLDKIKEQMPELSELHTDGGYGSKENDQKMKELEITHIQTAVKGRKAKVDMRIEPINDTSYSVICPHQEVVSTLTKRGYKACFDLSICNKCSLLEDCQSRKQKHCRVFYFDKSIVLSKHRHKNINQIPVERRSIRSNVEATVQEFKHRLNNGKLKVRELFRVILFALNKAISINFGRIYRLIEKNLKKYRLIYIYLSNLMKIYIKIYINFKIQGKIKYYSFLT